MLIIEQMSVKVQSAELDEGSFIEVCGSTSINGHLNSHTVNFDCDYLYFGVAMILTKRENILFVATSR